MTRVFLGSPLVESWYSVRGPAQLGAGDLWAPTWGQKDGVRSVAEVISPHTPGEGKGHRARSALASRRPTPAAWTQLQVHTTTLSRSTELRGEARTAVDQLAKGQQAVTGLAHRSPPVLMFSFLPRKPESV